MTGVLVGFAVGRFVYSPFDVDRLVVYTVRPDAPPPAVYERTCDESVLGYFEYERDDDG